MENMLSRQKWKDKVDFFLNNQDVESPIISLLPDITKVNPRLIICILEPLGVTRLEVLIETNIIINRDKGYLEIKSNYNIASRSFLKTGVDMSHYITEITYPYINDYSTILVGKAKSSSNLSIDDKLKNVMGVYQNIYNRYIESKIKEKKEKN